MSNLLKINRERIVRWPVRVAVPRADGSAEADTLTIEAEFRLLTRSEMKAIASASDEESRTLLAERVVGWSGVADADDAPLPCTPETVAAVLDVPYLAAALMLALVDASNGGACVKNALRGFATSSAPTV